MSNFPESNSFAESLITTSPEINSLDSLSPLEAKTNISGASNLELETTLGNWQDDREIIFIDETITDVNNLITGINPNAEIIRLETGKDGIEKISEVLAQRQDISGVHIVSHGSAGSLELGSTKLSHENIEKYGDILQQWGSSLSPEADILLYGCDVAEGEIGESFVTKFSTFTGADVAASDDLTGNTVYGGDDWLLEYETGNIETNAFSGNANFSEVLNEVSLVDNKLLFDEGGTDNDISISLSNNNIIFSDQNNSIDAGTGVIDTDNNPNSVTLNWSGLSFTDFEINTNEVTFASNLFLNGAHLNVKAENITVNSGITLSTRQISGSDHLNDLSAGNSGNINFTINEAFGGGEIIIGKVGETQAQILTHAKNENSTAYTDGNINFSVTKKVVGSVILDIDTAESKIELNNATVQGGKVDFTAVAGMSEAFEKDDSGKEKNLGENLKDVFSDDESGGTIQVVAGVVVADSTSEVLVNSSNITATDLNISAQAKATGKINPIASVNFGVGIGVGDVDSIARAKIDSNSTINVDNKFTLESNTENDLNIIGSPAPIAKPVTGDSQSPDKTLGLSAGIAVTNSDMESIAQIAQGANIAVGNLDVSALSKEKHRVEANGAAIQDGRLGIAVAISDSDSTTKALVDGNVTSTKDILISAKSDKENSTSATSKIGSNVIEQKIGKILDENAVTQGFAGILDFNGSASRYVAEFLNKKLQQSSGDYKFLEEYGLSASIAVVNDDSDTVARIGDGANVTSNGNIIVNAEAEITPYTSATAIANSRVEPNQSERTSRDYAGSGAIQVNNFDTTAKAYIGKNAIVNAKDSLSVTSNTKYPYDPSIIGFIGEGVGYVTSSLPTLLGTVVDNAVEAGAETINPGQTFTSWTRSAATGAKEMGLGVSVSYFDIVNNSSAYIDEGAQINQTSGYSSAVSVKATSEVETVNVAGVLGIPVIEERVGVPEEVAGVGGTVLVINNSNNVSAVIHDGVKIKAKTVEVDSKTAAKQLTIGVSGGKAETVGVNGTVSVLSIENNTIAQIDSGAEIVTGSDTFSGTNVNVKVNAVDDSRIIGISGGVAAAKNVGIGFSVGVNDLKRNTQAVMGNIADAATQGIVNQAVTGTFVENTALETDTGGSVTSEQDIDVKSNNTGYVLSLALAGATAVDRGSKNNETNNRPPANSIKLTKSNTTQKQTSPTTTSVFGKLKDALEGKLYITVSGEWLDNDIHDDTKAYIKNATINASDTNVNALNDSDVWALAGGFALNYRSSNGSSLASIGFAGSWSDNFIEGETSAYVESSTLNLILNLDVSATTSRDIKSLAASGSGVINKSSGSPLAGTLAGSVTNNEITTQTLAYLKNTTLESLNLSVAAKDTSQILSGAGAVAVTLADKSGNPGGSIGASWADNEVASSTLAYLENSTVKVAANIDVEAENSSKISTLSATLGVTNQAGAFAASVSINDIDNNTKAYINGGLVTEGDSSNKTDSLSLSAKDTSVINSISGSGAIADKAGVGFAFAWNDIENKTESYINAARVNEVEGDIAIAAISEAKIKTFAIGGSFGSTAAVAGSTSINQIENETNAYLAAANLDKTKNLKLTAKDSSKILALGGGISASDQGTAVGAAVAINEIGDSDKRVQAYIKGGTVNATENVKLEAKANSRILAITAGGSGGDKFSFGGSVSVNYLSINPTAYIEGGAIVNADGNIAITADSELELDLIAGGVGIAKNTAIGIGTTILTTENTVAAYISGETTQVNAKGNGIGVTFFNGERDDNGNKFITTANGLIVLAHNYDDILSVAAAGAFSESTAAGAGSATVNTILNTTKAYLDDRVKINQNVSAANAAQSIYVFAWDEADLNNVAGSLVFTGGSAGLAGGVNVGVISRTTEAYIGVAALVDAKNNIYVNALNTDEITPIAASVGIAKTAGVAGSVSVLVINENTKAYIGNDAVVRANNNIVVDADSRSEIDLVSGSLGGSEKVGVGVSADVPVINKTTEAYIGTNAQVTALALGDAVAVSTGEFESKYLPVQTTKFGASNIGFSNETITFSENHGFRTGDMVIFGKNSSGAISALTDKQTYYAVVIDNKTIKLAESLADVIDAKYIDFTSATGSNHTLQSLVDAETQDVGSQTGRTFGSDKVSSSNNSINFGQKHGLITGQAITYNNPSGTVIGGLENGKTYYVIADANNSNVIKLATSRANAEAGTAINITSEGSGSGHRLQFFPNGKQITTAKTKLIKGLAVTATSINDMMSIGAAGSVAGSADVSLGVALGASVYVLNNQTKAHIDSSAKINQNNADAGTEQSVHVVAGSDVDILGIGGVLAVGAAQVGGAAAPGANVTVVNNTTEAYVGQLATVNARQDVRVEATAKEDIFGLAASLAGSGGEVAVSLAGSASVFALKNKTHAFLGQDTQVNAGGNVLVRAKDDTELDSIAGSIGLGIGIGGGLGGSVGVIVLEKDTQAYISDRAIVNAAGNGNSTINVIKNDNTGTEAIRGIGIQATSTEDIFTLAAAGGGGLVGIAGAVTVTNIDSDTKAYVGLNARLNQNNQNASNEQTVNVTSTNKSEITTGAGSLALGLVGISGGVDIGTIQNNTTAYINDGSQVAARKDLTVNAFSKQDIDSNAINVGAGGIGIAGSVGVYSIGTKLNADSQQAIKSSQGDTIQYANDLFKPSSSLTKTLNSYNNQSDLSNLQGNVGTTTTTQIQNGTSGDRVKTAFARQEVEGTTAFIGKNVTVTTGRDINVKADAKLDLDALAGGAAIGGAGIGGSVVVANINNTVLAYTDESSQLNAVNNINVKANNNETVKATTYGGQGGTVGLGASVAKITLNRDVRAYLANNTKVNQANNLDVSANTVSNLTANALNLSIGFIAAGVSWGSVNSTGFTKAYLGDGVTVNNTQNLNIKAQSQDTVTTKSNASSGGLALNGSGSIAEINLTPTVEAYIGANANLTLTSNANIEAQAQGKVTSEAKGVQVSGGIGVGISDAEANWTPTVFASVGNSTQLNANDITIKAFTPNNTNNTVNAIASPSAGSLLGSGVGADAETRIDSKVLANVGEKAKLNASNNLNLIADSYNQGDAKANGKSYTLFVGAGSADSSVQIINITKATTAADVELKANKTIKIDAKSTNNGGSEAIAGAAGAISGNGSDALMNLTNLTTAELGDRTKINSDQNIDSLNGQNRQLLMYANSNINLNTKVEQDVDGLGSGNYVEGNTSVSSNTDTKIGTEAQVKVNNLTLDAKENNVSIKTDARAETIAVASIVDAEAIQNTTLNTKASIASKATIVVRDNLNVSATQDLDAINNYSNVDVYGIGLDEAHATNILNATAEISADNTVVIDTNNTPKTSVLTVVSVTPSPTGFSNDADEYDALSSDDEYETTTDNRRSLNNFQALVGASQLIVDNLSDVDNGNYASGNLTLREAIAQVLPGGTISFKENLAGNTIILNSKLDIQKNLTIDGSNTSITISGNNTTQIFDVDNNSSSLLNVTISGLTLTKGKSSYGGAIENRENLTLSSVALTENNALSHGGAIFHTSGNLTLSNVNLQNNSATEGGAIRIDGGTANISQSSFLNNIATTVDGGAISNSANTTLSQVTISGNSANNGKGGAIWNSNSANLNIRNSTITKNTANDGGGVYSNGTNPTKVVSSIIAGNTKTNNSTKDDVGGLSFISEGYNLVGAGSGLSKFGQSIQDNQQDPIDALPGNSSSYIFIADSLAKELNSSSGNGLPDNGYFAANTDHPNIELAYGQRYEKTNAVHVLGQESITYNLNDYEQRNYETLHLLATSTLGKTGVKVQVTYTDGTVSSIQQIVPDWFDDPGIDLGGTADDLTTFPQGVYTLFNGTDRVETEKLSTQGLVNANDAAIFGLQVSVNPNKTLQKITVVNEDTPINSQGTIDPSNLFILGITGKTPQQEVFNLEIAKLFNKDIIANKYNSDILTVDNDQIGLEGLTPNKTGTYTHPLSRNSLANDNGSNPDNLQVDQRNTFRVVGSQIDIGAHESKRYDTEDYFIVVDTLTDKDDGNFSAGNLSLREAIAYADSGSTIAFSPELADSTIALGEGELVIEENLTIDGQDLNITISGLTNSRIFKVDNDNTTAIDVTLKNLNLTEGSAENGGAIFNQENLTIIDSNIFDNQATNGGGIFNGFEDINNIIFNDVKLNLLNTSVYNNQATNGGGIFNQTVVSDKRSLLGIANIRNSTISGNVASESGGGIYNSFGYTSITNSTITNNNAPAGQGSGIITRGNAISPTITELGSAIVAGNINSDINTIFGGSAGINSLGYNLLGTGDLGSFNRAGDIITQDPKLDSLADNGGKTLTHALLSGSPAINAGYKFTDLYTDQRGQQRVSGVQADIGAYELGNQPPLLSLENQVEDIPENTEIPDGEPLKVADIVITDEDELQGNYGFSLTGNDANKFELIPGSNPYLVLKPGTVLDYETQQQLQVTVNVDDTTIRGSNVDASVTYDLVVSDRNEEPSISLQDTLTTIPQSFDKTQKVSDIVITDDALGTNNLTLAGDDANLFEIRENSLYLKANTTLDALINPRLDVEVVVNDPDFSFSDRDSLSIAITTDSLVVNTLDDEDNDNAGSEISNLSLREALKMVDDGGTISFAPNLANQTLQLTKGQLTIDKSVTIVGDNITLVAGRLDVPSWETNVPIRILNIDNGQSSVANVILENLNLTKGGGGGADEGSAIYNQENLTINDSKIYENNSIFGAIYNQESLTINNSILQKNTSLGDGGAIYNQKDLTINNSEIFGNQADSVGDQGNGEGGAIYNNKNLTITNSNIWQNTSTGNGSAIYNKQNLTITNSNINDNRNFNENSSEYDGGAIFNEQKLTITNSSLYDNKGGAINTTNGTVNLSQNTIYLNSVSDENKGIIFVDNSQVTISNSTITRNFSTAISSQNNGSVKFASSIIFNLNFNSDSDGNIRGSNFISQGYNLFPSSITDTGFTTAAGDILYSGFLNLGEPANRGGATPTFALSPGNPAVDKGSNPNNLTTDQRGEQRVSGLRIDIGAYELANQPPTLSLQNQVPSLLEGTEIPNGSPLKVADINFRDDNIGTNGNLYLTGADANKFELIPGNNPYLVLKSGAVLDYETQQQLEVTVNVDDSTTTNNPDSSVTYTLNVEDLNEAPTISLQNTVTSISQSLDTAQKVADIVITDDALGAKDLTLGGVDANLFEIVDKVLYLTAGIDLETRNLSPLKVDVIVSDSVIDATDEVSLTISLSSNNLKVDNLVDENDGDYGAGDLSLREALQLIEDEGTISIDLTLEGEILTLTEGELLLNKDLTVMGNGITINGNYSNRIFNINDGQNSAANVVIEDLTLTEGFASEKGGAIFNQENLTINNSNIDDNYVYEDGGAIFNQGSLTINNSNIHDNDAYEDGGAIFNQGNLTVNNTTLYNNTAINGGAIFNQGNLSLSNGTLSGNTSENRGGAIFVENSTVNLGNSTITNNNAGIGSGIFSSNGLVRVTSSIVAGNQINNDVVGFTFIDRGHNLVGGGNASNIFAANNLVTEIDNVQDSIDNSNFALLTNSVAKTFSSEGNGLPDDGFFAANSEHPDVQLVYPNGNNNARIVDFGDSFNFSVTPDNYNRIDLFFLATEGDSTTQVEFTYTDGTKATFNRTVPDWFNNNLPSDTYYLIDNLDRAKGDTTGFENSNNPAIFGLRFNLDTDKEVENISVSNTNNNGSYLVFFGGTGSSSTTRQFNVASVLNKDVIVNNLPTNPQLAPLRDNGNGIMTHALLPNSPAINAGSNPNNLTTDTRGLPRTQGNGIDIGAVEMQPVNVDLDSTTQGINYTTTFVEDGVEAIAIIPNPTITDADLNDSITEIKVTLTNRLDVTDEGLSVNGTFGSIGTVNLNNVKEIVLTGLTATHTEVENFLSAITYNNTSDTPNNSDRNIQITVSDGILTSPVTVTTVQITAANDTPTLTLENAVTSIPENTVIATPLKVADLKITDDNQGTNNLTPTGIDASKFEIVGNELFLKTGTLLDYETKNQLQVTVNLDDPTLGNTNEDTQTLTIAISDILELPEINLKQGLTNLPSGSIQNFSSVGINTGSVEQTFTIENTGNAPLNLNNLTINGANAADFSLMNNLSNREIAAGANLELTIRFQPTQIGDRTTTLTIFNNDSNESIYTLTLKGTAISTKNITGTDSNDTITINSPTSNSIVNAGNGNDLVNGNNGSEYILAGSGSDLIYGGAGNDRLFGDEGDDRIDGGIGNDLLRGGDGLDLLLGKEGSDNLVGDGGDDYLDGGTANDLLTGAAGNDTFVLSADLSTDTIYDFNVNEDRFELNGLEVSQLSFTNSGSDCSISVGTKIIAKVRNVTATQLLDYFQTKYQQ